MRSRLSIFAIALSCLSALAYAQDNPKKCTQSARECEQQIRQMLTGRMYLGVLLEEINPGLGVKAVVPDSPAERADLRPGDKVIAVNGRSMKEASIADFKALLGTTRQPRHMWMLVQRHGAFHRLDVWLEPYSKAMIDKIVAQHLAQSHTMTASGGTPQQ